MSSNERYFLVMRGIMVLGDRFSAQLRTSSYEREVFFR